MLSDGIVLLLTLMKTYLKSSSLVEPLESSPTVRGALIRDSEHCSYYCPSIKLIVLGLASICFSWGQFFLRIGIWSHHNPRFLCVINVIGIGTARQTVLRDVRPGQRCMCSWRSVLS